MDAIEFRFEAGDENSSRDLRTLALHLTGDHQLREHTRVLVQSEPVRPGEMGAAEVVLAAVSAAVGVSQLAVAVRAWRDDLNRSTNVRLVVPEEHRERARAVFEALSGSPKERITKRNGRIDPASSACVLIGVDSYLDGDLPSLRAVYNNIEQLHEVLTDEDVWGIGPGRIRKVHNPRSAAELIRPIREMSELATDTLVVYYAGHGLKDLEENELYLALPGSVPGQPETSVRYKALKQAIAQSRHAQRVIVVLDCCYSGVAMDGAMAQAVEDIRADAGVDDVRGSYLMCSAAPNRKALAPNPDKCTVFTGELVDVLRGGIPDTPDPTLSLGVVFREVRHRLRRDRRPEPQEQDQNQVGELSFVHNFAQKPAPAEVAVVTAPRRKGRRALATTAVALIAFGAGFAVRPTIDWVRELDPVPPGGPCSANATLLSYSDQLNGLAVANEVVTGLSALALEPGGAKLYALADNAPGRVFPLTVGDPNRLDITAERAITLKSAADVVLTGEIDSEGLVFEPGGRTMLISTERPTAIRRFGIDGVEVGPNVEIPKSMREPSVDPKFPDDPANPARAQSGRTIESLAMTPYGDYLYAGWEAPLSIDGDVQGRNRVRIQRYHLKSEGAYEPDRQYAYETDSGLYLVDFAVVGPDRLLALERQYVEGFGNTIRVYDVRLDTTKNVTTETTLSDDSADTFVRRTLLFNLANCPAGSPGQVVANQKQPNPLLDNVEGMAVGPETPDGRLLYLVSDNNANPKQTTRMYAFRIKLPA
ncbi:effector-associated constant component EACC1 [Actinokineospora diospyrosa]|uniref:Caspase domain-containing protein n=1 Tax=Actinokineospora diospyrosa TaxID=103728 RepID=A0ABT1IJ52_9PSEU|nr:esterase-like activity of phytase family protein [Actinokineospora diospyrosa]MCP2272236.1 hypothetical protein [Actinokineospora diospyrosa]